MRKGFLAAAFFLSGSVVAIAQLQPLNVQTGAWEISQVSTPTEPSLPRCRRG